MLGITRCVQCLCVLEGADFLSTTPHLFAPELTIKRVVGIVAVWAESSGRVEQSLLCNFLSAWIGRAVGCWWAQHNNLTSIICPWESAVAVLRTLSSTPAVVNLTRQPRSTRVSINNQTQAAWGQQDRSFLNILGIFQNSADFFHPHVPFDLIFRPMGSLNARF